MSSHNDSRKSPSVLYNGNRIDLFQPFVHHTRSTNVSESGSAPVTLTMSGLPPAHVQSGKRKVESVSLLRALEVERFDSLCDGHGNVVNGKASFQKEVLAHVSEG